MNNHILQTILKTINLDDKFLNQVTINGSDPILPSPFLIGEAGAAALALVGYLASMLWQQKTGDLQNIAVNVVDAALAQLLHQLKQK